MVVATLHSALPAACVLFENDRILLSKKNFADDTSIGQD